MNDKGVDIPDVFRRPGNTTEQKKLIKKLTEGKPVQFSDYNFYTLASVIKVLAKLWGSILYKCISGNRNLWQQEKSLVTASQ